MLLNFNSEGFLHKTITLIFDFNALGRIHRDQQCHIFTFEKNNTTYFDMLSQDRDGNLKGFVKLFLNDLPIHYD
jgi:hypothetical protein